MGVHGSKVSFWFTEGGNEPIRYVTQGSGHLAGLVARKLSAELGGPVTCWPNAELPLNMVGGSPYVWRCTWFDDSTDTYREGFAAATEITPGTECSICRRWHGLEIVHAAE